MDSSITGKGKLLLAYALLGIIFGLVAVGIMNMLAGIFSISFGTDLSNVFAMLFDITNGVGILFAVVNLLVLAGLVWIFGMIGMYITSKIIGGKAKYTKRPHLPSFVILGVITVAVIGMFNQAIAGVSPNVPLTDIMTLFGASGILPAIGSFIAFSALGFFVILLGSKGVEIAENKTPEYLKKV